MSSNVLECILYPSTETRNVGSNSTFRSTFAHTSRKSFRIDTLNGGIAVRWKKKLRHYHHVLGKGLFHPAFFATEETTLDYSVVLGQQWSTGWFRNLEHTAKHQAWGGLSVREEILNTIYILGYTKQQKKQNNNIVKSAEHNMHPLLPSNEFDAPFAYCSFPCWPVGCREAHFARQMNP